MLIKKRYLVILSVAVISIMLGSLLYNNVTQALKGKEPTEVDVINLPIDEQGNLRTTIVQSSKIMLVFNETLTVSSSRDTYNYLTSFNSSGYKLAYMVAEAQGSVEANANMQIHKTVSKQNHTVTEYSQVCLKAIHLQ